MATLNYCTASELAAILTVCQEEIIAEWRLRAAELLVELELDTPTIVDHLPDITAEIIRDLALGRDGVLSAEHTKGSPPVHGVQRFHDGLNIGEVVSEYNLLRAAFNTIAERKGYYVMGEGAHIINHRIDEAIRLAVTAYAAQQALMRKEHQNEHLAFIAHDLRTPLFAVSLIVDTLKVSLDPKSLASTEDLFDVMRRNLQRIEELVKRVLERNAQIATDSSFKPERRIFELWPLVQRLIGDLSTMAAKSEVTVVNEIPHALTTFADAGLISQVFQNLLSNAFRYAPQGRVVISAIEDHGTVRCFVRDNGAGIPPNMIEKVFDKLATDPEADGTGLGLAIVKQIVEAHAGTVNVESTPGKNTIFTFSIPAQG